MYEITMRNGDRAEAETVAACLVAVATMAEDGGWEDGNVTYRVQHTAADGSLHDHDDLRIVLNLHLREVWQR